MRDRKRLVEGDRIRLFPFIRLPEEPQGDDEEENNKFSKLGNGNQRKEVADDGVVGSINGRLREEESEGAHQNDQRYEQQINENSEASNPQMEMMSSHL